MAIDPALITTVQVSELPPASFVPESILAHQIGDILSRGTVQEFVDYIRSQSVSLPYEIKVLRPPGNGVDYINENFDMTIGATQGIGKEEGLWNGWAICNGNNGTDNDDGITYIGYGANYGTIGQNTGSATHTLTTSQIPNLQITIPGSSADVGDPGSRVLTSDSLPNPGINVTVNSGGGQSHNNMQPSKVVLKIMKLP